MEIFQSRNALVLLHVLQRISVNDAVEDQRIHQSAVLSFCQCIVRHDAAAVADRTSVRSEKLMCQ